MFTSLPIIWGEADSMAAMLQDDQSPHWARAVLTEHGVVEPLDRLSLNAKPGALGGLDALIVAQPRPLAPDENVALDDWVRSGGRVLLFADPMLTEHSDFALGDARRPQDVVLLSPILGRWGLRLEFDDAQPAGERSVEVLDTQVPVNLPGRFVVTDPSAGCQIISDGLVARCRIGKGRALILADAALLESESPDGRDGRAIALKRLLKAAFRTK